MFRSRGPLGALRSAESRHGGMGPALTNLPFQAPRWRKLERRLEILIISAVLIVEIIRTGIVVIRRRRRRVRLVVRVLRVLLSLADLRPVGIGVLPGLVEAVRDEDVVEDRAR